MSQQELLKNVLRALEDAQIDYLVTGSLASSLQGEPRSTHDIDVVVDIQVADIKKLARSFPPPDFYLDESAMRTAIEHQNMFNLIDISSGGKVDFWILTNEPFDRSRFGRRYTEHFMGIDFTVSSPEDTILAKLRWAKLSGGSEKQFTDALRVYEVQFNALDLAYLKRWVRQLALESLWERLTGEAEPL